jgi:alanine-glyoxylate transaminase/(R)-3-amino-2-methylpropionate-pyruvate transaminase
MYHHESSAYLAKDIVERLPPHPSGEDWVVHFVNDGSEAVDLAVQMARTYTGRPEMYALHKAYHGLHGYATGLTAIGKSNQSAYSSMYTSISHVESNNLDQLENSLKYTTSGKVAGMIIEPLQGFGGIIPLDKDYMKNAFDLIHQYGGITIADEVQTGYNRCGQSFWGFEMDNNDVIPDMVTIAKGMGNGTGIIGAVICKRSIAEAFSTKMFFNTYGGNPMSCQVAREVLSIMDDEDILGNCQKQGKLFKKRLTELCEKYPDIYKEARGEGLFQGLEINGKDADEKLNNAIELHNMLFDKGIIIGRGSAMGNVFRIQPPMCISTASVEYVCDMLEEVAKKHLGHCS